VGASWEIDVWGKLRAGREAAKVNLQATELDYKYARMSLAASVAKGFFTATQARVLVRLAENTVEIQERTTRVTEKQHEVGQASMQDVHLARAQLDQAESALRQTISTHKQVQRSLEILVGRYPAAEILGSHDLSKLPAPLPDGVPADLIQRRPDLVAAEHRVASAFYLTEQAKLAKLPSFTLSGGVGGNDQLSNAIANLAAGLVAPIFTGGALSAQIDQADANQEAAMAAYGQNLLTAFEEVETSLTNDALFQEEERFLISMEHNSERAYEMARFAWEVGQTDLLSVLIIQEQWINARIGVVNIRAARLNQRVNLHLALGGSFESKPESDAGGQGD
jgi:NodT family efflux transporter outer membrane factor (OMF) lipoprotein